MIEAANGRAATRKYMTISKHVSANGKHFYKEGSTIIMLSGIADFVAWILDKTGDTPEMEWFDKNGDILHKNGL